MITEQPPKLTLEELSSEVVRQLKDRNIFAAHQDNRVSAAPDARTIRYYTTLGLLDRPMIEGRVAKYTQRHLLQVLAIKSLQSVSLPLSEIQTMLYGRSDSELETAISSCQLSRQTGGNSQATTQELQKWGKVSCWHEVTIDSGLKIMADEAFLSHLDKQTADDLDELKEKISLAIDQLKLVARRANGGQQ